MGGILLLAILLAVRTYSSHLDQFTFNTENGAWNIAANLIHGEGYSACDKDYFPFCGPENQATAMREPVSVFVMALAQTIYPHHDAGMFAQTLLYLFTTYAIYILMREQGDIRVALLASLFWTLSIPVFLEVQRDNGHLAGALFYSIGLLYIFRATARNLTHDFLLAGIFMGLAALSRSIFLGITVGLGCALFMYQYRTRNPSQVFKSLIFVTATLLIIAPWALRNQVVLGSPISGSSLTGYNIFRMNYFLGDKPFTPHYVGPAESRQVVDKLIAEGDLTGQENEAEMQEFFSAAGKRIILQHPVRYILLSLYRFVILWFNLGVDAAYNNPPTLLNRLAIIQQVFILIFVMFGFLKGYRKFWLPALALFLGCAAYMAVNSQVRYLVDMMPNIAILSAMGISEIPFIQKIFFKADTL
ncbi:MAG TPA: glycosyltransferase family 39 protein [Anaerolineales bacterium]|nr:glycosyltransferase family 39 protein [Anaerolineales bacterium]